jgi:putative NADH-flavin reductase
MKLVVLGATGGTGLEIIRQTIKRGHSVAAFVRSPERLSMPAFDDHLDIIKGDLLNQPELERVIEGRDAVLSAFGTRTGEPRVQGRFATALRKAMMQTGVQRVALMSTSFLFQDSIAPFIVGRLFFRRVMTDASEMEGVISESGLDWTIVRPVRLTDAPYTGRYRVQEGHLPTLGFTISRADVADFMIKAVENRSSPRKIVGVCN